MNREQVRELFAAAITQVSQGERDGVIAELIQAAFDRHKEAGTVPALVGALLDVQAVVIVSVEHGGGMIAEYSLHKECAAPVADFVGNVMRSISVVADSVPEEVEQG